MLCTSKALELAVDEFVVRTSTSHISAAYTRYQLACDIVKVLQYLSAAIVLDTWMNSLHCYFLHCN